MSSRSSHPRLPRRSGHLERRPAAKAQDVVTPPRCQANGETKFWSKLKGGAKGFYKELGGLLPLVCSALLRASCGGHTLKDEVVTTVTLTGKVYRIDEYGKVRCQIADNRPVKSALDCRKLTARGFSGA